MGSAKYKIKDSRSFDCPGQDGGLFAHGDVHPDEVVPAGLLGPAQEVVEIGRQYALIGTHDVNQGAAEGLNQGLDQDAQFDDLGFGQVNLVASGALQFAADHLDIVFLGSGILVVFKQVFLSLGLSLAPSDLVDGLIYIPGCSRKNVELGHATLDHLTFLLGQLQLLGSKAFQFCVDLFDLPIGVFCKPLQFNREPQIAPEEDSPCLVPL